MNNKPKLIFVVTEDWYFYSHRRPMIKAAQAEGFDVAVITNIDKHKSAIEALGVKVIAFPFERRSLNPFKALGQVRKLAAIYRDEQPDIVHHIAMKPILLGAMAAWIAKLSCVINAFAGLGYVFNARSFRARLIKAGLLLPFFVLLRRKNSYLLMQNKDDLAVLKKYGLVVDERTRIIRGSGIDLNEYPVTPVCSPDHDFICVFAGRMIGIKGLPTLKKAFALLETGSPHIKLKLYGKADPENPGSWNTEELQAWDADSDNVSYEGHADNMSDVWASAHVALQVSYGGEGVPKSLLEGAACGRPIIATDVPGCREVVDHGKNGFLVAPYDEVALAKAIETLASDQDLCVSMGKASRKMVENDMSADSVRDQTADLYRLCLKIITDPIQNI